ncbi:hypothetical protein [Oceanicola sp. 502str15]|uniref:hypothetical protein n=1 Tax=Oceanicola sp. 502str15 TaxID=2696061 RepID=UPI00209426D5|nr:hypothetical protein [Oceanicola sp. 502str15]MCO6382005.1 hypothetical protein [Oceanicola sp. 502str15]
MRKWLISIVVVVILIGVGSFAWTVYRGVTGVVGVFTEVDDPVIAMKAAMDENRDEEAYAYLAPGLQATVSIADFEREFRAQQIWGDEGSFKFNSRSIATGKARIKGSYTRSDGTVLPVFVELEKLGDDWKIARFHFGAPPPGQEEWEI